LVGGGFANAWPTISRCSRGARLRAWFCMRGSSFDGRGIPIKPLLHSRDYVLL
jgi:hypothetical protein